MFKKIITSAILFAMLAVLPLSSAFAAERYEILKLGDRDEWVLELQEALYDGGYLKVKPTGYYGTDTQAAVIQYQKDKGLRVDGKAGPEVRGSLFGKDMKEIPASRFDKAENKTEKPAENKPGQGDELKLGDKGDAITEVQEALKKYGYYYYDKITGYYGPITEEAVLKFQRSNDLPETGIMDSASLLLLLEGEPKYYVMQQGDKGDDIDLMQQRLHALGYMDSSSTGYFGTITLAAVKDFQTENGLKADGKVGKNTRALLYSEDAKKASVKTESNKTEEKTEEKNKDRSMAEKFVDMAKAQLGKEYVYSTEGPDTFDCSGLVYYCLKNIGYKVSRQSSRGYASMASWEDVESKSDLMTGDLIFFRNSSSERISHVAIYMGGGQIIHAIPSENSVYISTLTGYWDKYYVSAKRIF